MSDGMNGRGARVEGSVSLDGVDLYRRDVSAVRVRRTVGMIFQEPDDQLFMPLVYDDVAFGHLNLGLSPE